MDKREYDSYDEIHEKLMQAMQDASTEDVSGEYRTPSVDLGFLAEDKSKKKFALKGLGKIAIFTLIMLLSINAVLLATGSGESYSDKGLLHRIYEGARGIFTDSEENQDVQFNDTGDTYRTTDFDNIDEAKQFWPELCVPKYIPEGYIFMDLYISKELSGEYRARYNFKKDSSKLIIIVYSNCKNGENISIELGDFTKYKDQIINIYWDDVYGFYVADLYTESIEACIYGLSDEEETRHVTLNLK